MSLLIPFQLITLTHMHFFPFKTALIPFRFITCKFILKITSILDNISIQIKWGTRNRTYDNIKLPKFLFFGASHFNHSFSFLHLKKQKLKTNIYFIHYLFLQWKYFASETRMTIFIKAKLIRHTDI